MYKTVNGIRQKIFNLLDMRLARSSTVLFVGSVVIGILGYTFHIVMGRMLTTAEYGLFAAIVAMLTIFSIPTSTLTMAITRRVSEYRAHNDYGSIAHLYVTTNRWVLVFSAVFLIVYLLAVPQIQGYLHSQSRAPIYLLGILVVVSLVTPIGFAVLQGIQEFGLITLNNVFAGVCKILFCALLVWLGYGVGGAVAGVIIALAIVWLNVYLLTRKYLKNESGVHNRQHYPWRGMVPLILANAAFVCMTQLDMVLVSHYFEPAEAGIYAAASVLGKAVLYLPGAIVMALFPMVAENTAKNLGSAELLINAVAMTLALSCVGTMFYFVFSSEILLLLYGPKYMVASNILSYFGLAMIPMALVMVAEYFLIAKGRIMFVYLLMVAAPLEILGIHYFHGSLSEVVAIIAGCGWILAIAGYALLWSEYQRGISTK